MLPSLGWLSFLGAAVVLLPGLVVFVLGRVCGLGTGASGAWALLAMLVGLVAYPLYLRRLGRRLTP